MDRPIRVFFVDDEPRLRSLWQVLIGEQTDMDLVEALQSADQLADKVPDDGDSVVLLDLSMPGRDPLETVAEIRETRPRCRVIVFSGYSDPDTVNQALASGAWGLVDKLTPPPEILDSIRRVARGEAVFPGPYSG